MITERRFLLGVDLAKAFDFTSFAAIEMTVSKEDGKVSEGHYSLRGLERIKGQEYPAIEAGILSMY
jgi:hypothetical protein